MLLEGCCCNHGGRCSCAHRAEIPQLDTVPESVSDREIVVKTKVLVPSLKAPLRRRRANTTHADGEPILNESGRPKTAYANSKSLQKRGSYPLTRVGSMPEPSRSADNLFGNESRSSRELSANSVDRSQARSETASPHLSEASSLGRMHPLPPPLDLSATEYPPYGSNYYEVCMPEGDRALYSAGLGSAPIDWNRYFGHGRPGEALDHPSYGHSHGFNTYDLSGSEQAPTLVTTTSSEADDFMGPGLDDYDTGAYAGSTTGGGSGSGGYGMGPGQAALAYKARHTAGGLSLEDLDHMKSKNKFLPTPPSLAGDEPAMPATVDSNSNGCSFIEEEPAYWMHAYSPNMAGSPVPYWDT